MGFWSLFPKGVRGAVLVAALGYFVDVFDLLIFNIVRVPSLRALGVAPSEFLRTGAYLLQAQMAGVLLGGIFWGMIGDKRGRISVLLGSIFLYSIANIANAFAADIIQYSIWRFVAGFGLAGELGVGITLVSELMPKETRGFGTTLVASVGVGGAVLAAVVGEKLSWQTAYLVGGGLGLILLMLRISISESHLFEKTKIHSDLKRGDFTHLLATRDRTLRYLNCILVGLPIWFVIGILVTFSPEFGQEFRIPESVSAGHAVLLTYIGLVLGDLSCGLLSQTFKNRKKVLFAYITFTAVFTAVFLFLPIPSARFLYAVCFPLGFGTGYWSVFVTNAAEQFGTNLRATVTTTVPNFVRGAVVIMTFAFEFLKSRQFTVVTSASVVGAVCLVGSYIALMHLDESFGRDLNFLE